MACAIAASQPARAQGTPGNDELAAQATDPTASLMSFQLNDWYTANFHGLDDTRNSRWASLGLGLNYGQVVSFAGHKWRPNIEADYDLKNDYGNPKWTIRASIVLLLPTH